MSASTSVAIVAQYLSEQWFDEMDTASAAYKPADPKDGRVALREIINGSPFGDVTYVMILDSGKVTISREDDVVADVTFTQDYATAVALHSGELTTHEAFFSGKVRVGGHLNTLLEHSDLLQGIAPAFQEVRSATTYE